MSKKKIQHVGLGNFIRSPRGRHGEGSKQTNVEVLQVSANNGNSFTCFPVTDASTVPVTVDTIRYQQIPIDTLVEQVTV